MGGGKSLIISELEKHYTYGAFVPKITIEDDWVIVEIDTEAIETQDEEYQKAVSLCEKRNFEAAKPILSKLITVNPTNSEFHRIMGQIYSEQGDQDKAIDYLIDALRWNPKNGWALTMMGNIFTQFKNDVPTAMKYYDQALNTNPDDFITINNIGAVLMKEGKNEEAKRFFNKALEKENYPNAFYGLALIAEKEYQYDTAFSNFIQTIKYSIDEGQLYHNSIKLALSIATKIVNEGGNEIIDKYRDVYLKRLEESGNTKIEIIADESIQTAAKLELAENHNRDKHRVIYKPSYPAVAHLILHELKHYEFMLNAREAEKNQLFVTNQSHERKFMEKHEPKIKQLRKKGIPSAEIRNFMMSLFHGINLQAYNAPIDLFIEDLLYYSDNQIHPYQFLSLFNMQQENIGSVNNQQVIELTPRNILSANKIYNLVGALQFKKLYGIDFIKQYNPSPSELSEAEELYNEYLEYFLKMYPGNEYELVINWAEDLGLSDYFELVDEKTFRTKRTDIDSLLTSIEQDPYDTDSNDLYKKAAMDTFQETAKEPTAQMAVAMYMVDALNYFEGQEQDKIRTTAFEIAILGTQGINPNNDNYHVNSIPNRTFSGLQMLAYYYVSWAIAAPEMLDKLQLPYDEEYRIAQQLYNKDK